MPGQGPFPRATGATKTGLNGKRKKKRRKFKIGWEGMAMWSGWLMGGVGGVNMFKIDDMKSSVSYLKYCFKRTSLSLFYYCFKWLGFLGSGHVHVFKKQLRNVFTTVWQGTFLHFCHKRCNVGTSWFMFRTRLQIRDWRESVQLTSNQWVSSTEFHGWLMNTNQRWRWCPVLLSPTTNPLSSTKTHVMNDFHINYTSPWEAESRIMQTLSTTCSNSMPFLPCESRTEELERAGPALLRGRWEIFVTFSSPNGTDQPCWPWCQCWVWGWGPCLYLIQWVPCRMKKAHWSWIAMGGRGVTKRQASVKTVVGRGKFKGKEVRFSVKSGKPQGIYKQAQCQP